MRGLRREPSAPHPPPLAGLESFVPAAKKVTLVAEIKEDIERALVAIASDHSGLEVAAFQELRRALAPADVRVRVVKNSLAKLAAEAAGRPEMAELLQGPTTLTFGYGDPVAPIRIFTEHVRTNRLALTVHGGWMEGRILSAAEVADVASIPPRDQLIAEIAGKLRSPIQNLASLLQATLREFNGLVEARANQLDDGSTPEAEPEAEAEATAEANEEAPAAEAEAPAEVEAEATAEPGAESETEATAEAEPPAEAEATAEPAAEVTAEAEAEAEAPAEAEATDIESTDEPSTAEAEEATETTPPAEST